MGVDIQAYEEHLKLEKERHMAIVKTNEFVRLSRYKLNVQELKIVAYLISQMKPQMTEIPRMTMSVKSFCDVCGINNSGRSRKQVQDSVLSLRNKGWWFEDEKSMSSVAWIEHVEYDKGKDTIELELSRKLTEYIVLKKIEKRTQYELISIIDMQSEYSIRLFELLKSYSSMGRAEFQVDELRKILGATAKTYKEYKHFKAKVLNLALSEINNGKYPILEVKLEVTRRNRKVDILIFNIKELTSFETVQKGHDNELEKTNVRIEEYE
jgi:hypothetical protein